ncbi:phage portal protein [Rhizorhabdus sp.]|uniref:phage portal protein n=1 Tax=Rhizorhabdus sp. TaxID=1968843 RepID=UPI0019AE78F6|nr:phage portal protein [Rhizorhabdus sp.]MBD3762457.1 phage portal protein [Rhizorhabdus sp.]
MPSVMTSADYLRNGIAGTRPGANVVASRPEPAEVTTSPFTDGRFWGDEFFGFTPLRAATAEHAARNAAVNFCCSTIAEAVGGLPFEVYQGDALAIGFELGEVLAYAPNPLQVGAEFWAAMAFSYALRGWAFSEPTIGSNGVEIWPLSPVRSRPEWGERSLRVHYQPEGRPSRILGPGDLFWFANMADGQVEPMAPWRMAKGSIDFAMALENQGRSYAQNGNRPGGTLESDMELGDEVIDRLKAQMAAWRRGGNAVLEGGLKYKVIETKNTDAQLLELIEQRIIEMCLFWRMPLSIALPKYAGKANSEQDALNFVRYVIRPIARRVEQAIRYRLLTPDMRARGISVKLNLDGFLRGDSATQARNAVLYRTASTHSVNEIRSKIFGLPEIDEDWAKDARTPLNSNRAADTATGGETAPNDKVDSEDD